MNKLMRTLLNRKRGAIADDSPDSAFSIQRKLITNNEPVIFDIGAKVGWAAKKYRKLFPDSKIHCFEPYPPSFETLSDNFSNDKLTFLNTLAVSDSTGSLPLHVNSAPGTNSLLPTDPDAYLTWGQGLLETTGTIEVNTITIDEYCHNNSISHIDILKLDIQGAEFSAFRGAKSLLENQLASLIYFEVIMAPTYDGQHSFRDYLNLLDSYDFEIFDLFNPVRKELKLVQTDLVFINKNLIKY